MIAAKNKEDRLSAWINRLRETRGMNKATVALANKLLSPRLGGIEQRHRVSAGVTR